MSDSIFVNKSIKFCCPAQLPGWYCR